MQRDSHISDQEDNIKNELLWMELRDEYIQLRCTVIQEESSCWLGAVICLFVFICSVLEIELKTSCHQLD